MTRQQARFVASRLAPLLKPCTGRSLATGARRWTRLPGGWVEL